jgi:hypothetical protein
VCQEEEPGAGLAARIAQVQRKFLCISIVIQGFIALVLAELPDKIERENTLEHSEIDALDSE